MATAKQALLDGRSSQEGSSAHLRHDLLAVVHTLGGAIELLLTTKLTARQRRYVNVCKRSADNLADLSRKVPAADAERSFQHLAIDDLAELGIAYVPKPITRAKLLEAVRAVDDRKRFRLLVADDSPDSCTLIEHFLKPAAKRLDIVNDGLGAVEKYQGRRGKYDLLVIDLDMPVMDGRTAIRKIRAWETSNDRPHVPIIVLTAHDLMARDDELRLTYDDDALDLREIIVEPDPEIAHLVPGFLAGRQQDVQTILHAMTDSNYDTIRTVGHMLKGTGGGYGFDGISEIGGRLEEGAERQAFEEIREAVAALAGYLGRVKVVGDTTPEPAPPEPVPDRVQY